MTQLTHNADSETTQTSPLSSSDLEREIQTHTKTQLKTTEVEQIEILRKPPKTRTVLKTMIPEGLQKAEGSSVDRKTLESKQLESPSVDSPLHWKNTGKWTPSH